MGAHKYLHKVDTDDENIRHEKKLLSHHKHNEHGNSARTRKVKLQEIINFSAGKEFMFTLYKDIMGRASKGGFTTISWEV